MSHANFKLVGGAILGGGCVFCFLSTFTQNNHIKKAVKKKTKLCKRNLFLKDKLHRNLLLLKNAH